jgi:hypothetical protein
VNAKSSIRLSILLSSPRKPLSVRPLQSIRVRGSSRLRGSSRGVVETRGRGDEARFAPRVASRPFERLTGRWTPCPAVISTRLRTPGPRLSSARSRLRACLAAARMSTLLASAPLQSPPLAPAGEPASSRGVGVHPTVTRRTPAFAPPPTHPPRVHSRCCHLRPRSNQPRSPVPPSWFLTTSTVSAARRLAGLLHPAAGPGVRRVSDREIGFPISRASPLARPPLEGHHLTHSRDAIARARCPLGVLPRFGTDMPLAGNAGPERGRRLRGLDPWEDARWGSALPRRFHRVPSWASLLFEVRRRRVPSRHSCHQERRPGSPAAVDRLPGSAGVVPAASFASLTVAGESSRPP